MPINLFKYVSKTENEIPKNSNSECKRISKTSSSAILSAHNRKKLFSICFFESNNFFGFGEIFSKPSEWFVAFDDNVNVIRISKENLLSIHRHSCFLISQLRENYKLAIPSSSQCTKMSKEKIKTKLQATKNLKRYYL